MRALLTVVGCVAVFAQQPPRSPAGALREIVPGHYVYSSTTYNSGIIATSEGVLVLDALNSEAVARAEREAIAGTIRQPIRVLVSSTFHNNYSKGNIAYADVLKVGHEHYRTDLVDLMQREKVSADEQKARLPNQTFRDRMTFYLGGKEIQVLYVGRAHTRGDSIVFVPQDRIAYLSEVYFDGRFPFMNSGYVDWIHALDVALNLEADIFVPGQGPSNLLSNTRASRQALVRARQVLVDFRDGVAKEIARGATEDQAVAAVLLPQYQGMTGYQQQREVLVRRTYQGLKGTLP